jgi:hypothetical protein
MRAGRSSVQAAILGLVIGSAVASAQTPPMTDEIPVNTFTTGLQGIRAGASAIDRFGNSLVVWSSFNEDGDAYGIYGQRFDASGSPLGAEFPVNTYTTANQNESVVAEDRNGNFVVAWQSNGQDGDGYGVFARRYDAGGNPLGGEVPVNGYTTGSQKRPAVAMSRAGRFVVVWWDASGHDGDADGIFGQLYDDNGQPVGGEIAVNTLTTGAQRYPSVAMRESGEFVVAWESAGADGDGYGVSARVFDAAGVAAGPEIPVNTFTTGDQRLPVVGMDRSGNFVVAWSSQNVDGSGTGVAARRFDAAGAPLTDEFLVNTTTLDYQGNPDLGMDRDGNFVVGWVGDDADLAGMFARAFDAAGDPTSDEFPVNVSTTGNQNYAAVAVNNRGQLVIGWENDGSDPSGDIAARLGAPQAFPLSLDLHAAPVGTSDLNGMLEDGESVIVEPQWKNTTGNLFSLFSVAANLSGPLGPSYVLNDGTADYADLDPGETDDCFHASGDCFVATVDSGGSRPAAHWDARLDEKLSTGVTKSWPLHVGESFPDVPRSHQFYRFIENVLHNGITGGCGAGNYCPDGSVTRGQMAVFLLKSKHDALYTPPPCSGVFPDVPCPSQFADWIEQLAAEQITGGCGGGNYCPNNSVTRQQMAVFLLKAEHGSSYTPPTCAGVFGDVPCPSPFADWIEQLAAEQITGGCGGGNYCPANPNTRGQMAVFLVRTFGFFLYGP